MNQGICGMPHPSRRTVSGPRRWSLLGLASVLCIAAAIYLTTYAGHPNRPHSAEIPGWIAWFDQSFYYKAARAWARGDLDPAQHWYMPGYALFAAPFAAFMPLHVFLLPDLIAVLAATWLFGRLTEELAPELPSPRLLGAGLFVLVSLGLPNLRDVWVVPNSSSLSTPIIYGCLLATVVFCRRPDRAWLVFLAAFAGGALGGLRPSDAIAPTLAACAGVFVTMAGNLRRPRQIAAAIAAGLLGVIAVAGTVGLAYYSLYGTAKSGYVQLSLMLGFEWRLLPLRWVLLALDPRPILASGKGLIEGFPWIVPGIAGIAAVLVRPATSRLFLANLLVAGAATLHTAYYLCYRDLHPAGLFQFSNFHYFKWVLPILALYAVRFAWALAAGPHRMTALAAGILPLLVLLPWRVSLDPVTPTIPLAPSYSGDALSFTADFNDLHNVLLVPTDADPGRLYGGGHALDIGGRTWGFVDFRAYPQPGGFMLTPLRPLGAGPATLRLEPKTGAFRPPAQPVLARMNIVFGLPCFIRPERPACTPTGWSYVELQSRFTDGNLALIRFRVPPELIGRKLTLDVDTYAYQPLKAAQLRVRPQMNGVELAQWKFPSANRVTVTTTIPPGVILKDGLATLALRIDNPRSRHNYDDNSNDLRELGLLVHAIKISPAN
eukprot:gene12766-12863_t